MGDGDNGSTMSPLTIRKQKSLKVIHALLQTLYPLGIFPLLCLPYFLIPYVELDDRTVQCNTHKPKYEVVL
ncbi:hypothetical protein IGI04_035120 [Brassica rapa subsp. trilocularis]|uniref:Uncharacterized protein n=1 Tax=Brassica rapa subsp. trilocularis TaxID=1813537 RepID=A0ABQ7LDG4_BRACM|nr:hypothetical protein IGI04_035120 [Brassica rapa subsp. trilocularis]